MKNFMTILFLVLLASTIMFPQSWQKQTVSVPSNVYVGPFSPVNENVCWASWSTSWISTTQFNNGFIRTTDGGATWSGGEISATENGNILWIEALNSDTAFFVVESWAAAGMQGIYKTTDGGITWIKHTTAYANSPYGPGYIHFFDNNNGVVVGEQNTGAGFEILTTTNCGMDWNAVPQENIPACNPGEMVQTSPTGEYGDCIWLTTFPPAGKGPRIFKTTDKGYHWTVIEPPGLTEMDIISIAFQNETNGLMVNFSPNNEVIKKTTDGGTTWQIINSPYGCVPDFISYIPNTTSGYVITGDANFCPTSGGSAYTLDGGDTWITIDTNNYIAPNFVSDKVGWSSHWGTNNVYKYVGIPLPVELTSFAASVNGNEVMIKWLTASEINNQGFEVQRLEVSGQKREANWMKIGFIKGHGTSTEQNKYSFVDKELGYGKYSYRLKQVDFDGTFKYSDVVEINLEKIFSYSLAQNYPNPFNPSTTIRYSIKQRANVNITILNAIGEKIFTLLNEEKKPGEYQIKFNAESMPSGVYFYKIKAGEFTSVRKMILLK